MLFSLSSRVFGAYSNFIFIDLKLPIEERNEVPILCFDNEIAWLVGYKVSESFKVTKDTKRIIRITFIRKE